MQECFYEKLTTRRQEELHKRAGSIYLTIQKERFMQIFFQKGPTKQGKYRKNSIMYHGDIFEQAQFVAWGRSVKRC